MCVINMNLISVLDQKLVGLSIDTKMKCLNHCVVELGG